jgi:hypothetical protein
MPELLTASEIVMRRTPSHAIPPITDPMGQYWEQPNRFDIEVDATHALMSQVTFDALKNYAHSQPTGVYPGKMWKWHCNGGNTWCPCGPGRPAMLMWFGPEFEEKGHKFCSNHSRIIVIA